MADSKALGCFYMLRYACDAAVLLSLQCTPTSLSHSPRERAVAAPVADSHSIYTGGETQRSPLNTFQKGGFS